MWCTWSWTPGCPAIKLCFPKMPHWLWVSFPFLHQNMMKLRIFEFKLRILRNWNFLTSIYWNMHTKFKKSTICPWKQKRKYNIIEFIEHLHYFKTLIALLEIIINILFFIEKYLEADYMLYNYFKKKLDKKVGHPFYNFSFIFGWMRHV